LTFYGFPVIFFLANAIWIELLERKSKVCNCLMLVTFNTAHFVKLSHPSSNL